MPIYEIQELRKKGSREQRVAMILALHASSILRGSRMANLLTIREGDIATVRKILAGTNISYRLLKSKNNRVILYLYRPEELTGYLRKESVRNFLKSYGYEGETPGEMLDLLSERITLHRNGKEEFPHEIGIFLGYPLEDVRSFLENKGENCAYVGYWKVYHNVEETVKLFKRYDEEREQVVEEVISGKTIQEIAV